MDVWQIILVTLDNRYDAQGKNLYPNLDFIFHPYLDPLPGNLPPHPQTQNRKKAPKKKEKKERKNQNNLASNLNPIPCCIECLLSTASSIGLQVHTGWGNTNLFASFAWVTNAHLVEVVQICLYPFWEVVDGFWSLHLPWDVGSFDWKIALFDVYYLTVWVQLVWMVVAILDGILQGETLDLLWH